VLDVAIEHRLTHAETLAYMLHQLPNERKLPQADPSSPTPQPVSRQTRTIPAGSMTPGRPRGETSGFEWDNEFEATTVKVPEFTIDTRKIASRQYLDFMDSGSPSLVSQAVSGTISVWLCGVSSVPHAA
jgi:formylglycine-generating enzyme required for sulfatase activity